jgi:hypothetical protein
MTRHPEPPGGAPRSTQSPPQGRPTRPPAPGPGDPPEPATHPPAAGSRLAVRRMGGTCDNCGQPNNLHCAVHLIPHCPGRCPGEADPRAQVEAVLDVLAPRIDCPPDLAGMPGMMPSVRVPKILLDYDGQPVRPTDAQCRAIAEQVVTAIRTASGPAASLEEYEIRGAGDPAKRDDELWHGPCGQRLCDVQPGDTLAVLDRVAAGHRCPR